MAGKGGLVQVPFYATVFRGDSLAKALTELAPASLRYGANSYSLTRSRDDRYRFLLTFGFDRYEDFTAFWEGSECQHFRIHCGGWYQIPVLYGWADELTSGATQMAASTSAE
ncbi:MAG: hypothetical protein NT122_02580 [Solirubrobacterales bacterium]|nr:hypothetical protein [Solirubrobacterales bacterium]